jgi:hypothetical protein
MTQLLALLVGALIIWRLVDVVKRIKKKLEDRDGSV